MKRWPVLVVALGVGGTVLAPDEAGADVTRDRVATSFSGGGAHALVVHPTRAVLSVATAPCGRVRGRGLAHDDERVMLDQTDPWTGEKIPEQRVAAPTRTALDETDPWNGQMIVVPGSALVRLETLDAYSPD